MDGGYRDLFVSAQDGLRVYARDYGPVVSSATPVVCLPGLARNSSDFHELALSLSQDATPRRVICVDYRGRGRSEWDQDWRNYDVRIEVNDILQILTVAGIENAVFVGTSRGGLIIMALGAVRPTLLRGAVLNDVGPVIEAKGLIRIRGYIGKLPKPRNFREAGQILKQMSDTQFPANTEEQWERLAKGTWQEKDGELVLSYDPALLRTLEALDLETPLPDLWPFFEGLKNIPVMVLRGANSDLLSATTLEEMQKRHPSLSAVTVPDQGHAPELEGALIETVGEFVRAAEQAVTSKA
ncbi:alpha/beta fold hydrolase [Microvirga flavescens]|uniref:alpha/beta fold hydrolase n=1 Tax=Microvirga flavescens TaxID=2249811 RepID=UPI000DD90EC0|nr:alpha/beta hydrolase [Microvirga flavescens]